jgi:hypothetical protein
MWTATLVAWPIAFSESGSVTTGVAENVKRRMTTIATRRRRRPMKVRMKVD